VGNTSPFAKEKRGFFFAKKAAKKLLFSSA
jgi:hypothetical protein